jgi:hypothetical protein
MADHVYRGSQSLLDVQGEENTPATKDQELVATLSVENEQQEEQQEQKLAALLTVEETRQTDEEQQNLVALLDVQETRDENTQEQEIIALLDVLDEIPPIPVNPPQGLQAELGLLYLYNPDVTNSLIKELNLTIQEMNSAIEDVTQLTVDAMKIKPYSLLGEPIAQNTPCTFDGCVYIAITTITQKDPVFNPAQWAKVGTADYNKLYNKPNFITREDLSCTALGLTYNSNNGVLSLTSGYVIPTSLKISQIDSGIATNAANLNAETQNRIQAINSANTRIDSLSADLTAEQTERIAADSSMANNITSINGRLVLHTSDYNNPHQVTKAQVGLGNVNNTADLDKPISTLTQQALDELSARIASTDADLSNYRTSAAQDLIDSQIRVEISNVAQSVTVEEAARMSADAVLGGRITGIEEIIPSTASTDNMLADVAFVNSSINNMAAYYITASASGNAFGNHARLISGPWYFQGQLRTPTMNDYALVVADETHDNKSARYLFDGVQWAFQYTLNNTEFTQAQIDAINSTITKGKVDSYDAHIIDTNNPHEVTAEQVGLGNVNNTSDMAKPVSTLQQAALNLKQNIIADLETIRSGAALGATAVQQADLAPYETISHAQATYQLKGNYVTTQTLNTALAGKQNVLTAGTGVTIENDVISVTQIQNISWGNITGSINNQLDLKNALNNKQDKLTAGENITIDENNVISATGGGSIDAIDNLTITKNASDEIQTAAILDSNGTILKFWSGTKAQYDAIPTHDSLTLYNITDDADPVNVYTKTEMNALLATKANANSVYTKSETYTQLEVNNQISTAVANLLGSLYPVGSLYIGTQSTCPMAALIPNSTWTLVAQDRALWGGNGSNANTTIEAGLPNIVGSGDVLGQSDFLLKTGNYSGCVQAKGSASGVSQAGNSARNTFNHGFSIDASRSSSVYRNDVTTVQPPAYRANVWRRTA